MDPLSLWEMMWELGIMAAVATPIIVLLGAIIFAIFKPLEFLDNL